MCVCVYAHVEVKFLISNDSDRSRVRFSSGETRPIGGDGKIGENLAGSEKRAWRGSTNCSKAGFITRCRHTFRPRSSFQLIRWKAKWVERLAGANISSRQQTRVQSVRHQVAAIIGPMTRTYARAHTAGQVKWPALVAENNVQFRRNCTYDPDSSRLTLSAHSEIPRNAWSSGRTTLLAIRRPIRCERNSAKIRPTGRKIHLQVEKATEHPPVRRILPPISLLLEPEMRRRRVRSRSIESRASLDE